MVLYVQCMSVNKRHHACALSHSECKAVMAESSRFTSGGFDAKTLWWPRPCLRHTRTHTKHPHPHTSNALCGWQDIKGLVALPQFHTGHIPSQDEKETNEWGPFYLLAHSISCRNLSQIEAILGYLVLCITGSFRITVFRNQSWSFSFEIKWLFFLGQINHCLCLVSDWWLGGSQTSGNQKVWKYWGSHNKSKWECYLQKNREVSCVFNNMADTSLLSLSCAMHMCCNMMIKQSDSFLRAHTVPALVTWSQYAWLCFSR